MSEDLLYEEIYQKTQDCGRSQFVKLLQQNQIRIDQLEKENHTLKQAVDNTYETSQDIMYEMQQENGSLGDTVNKASELLRKKENKIEELNNILTEFEKWLEEKIEITKIGLNGFEEYQKCLDKLQELKEGKK